MYNTRHIGRIIRNHREKKKYTLEYTAELCGMSDRGLAKIELGDSDPKWSSVISIAKVLGIDLGELTVCIPTEIEDHLAG